jgi:hypothetical protein
VERRATLRFGGAPSGCPLALINATPLTIRIFSQGASARYVVREAEIGKANHLAPTLRDGDRLEVASLGLTPIADLRKTFYSALYRRTAPIDDEIAAIWAVGRCVRAHRLSVADDGARHRASACVLSFEKLGRRVGGCSRRTSRAFCCSIGSTRHARPQRCAWACLRLPAARWSSEPFRFNSKWTVTTGALVAASPQQDNTCRLGAATMLVISFCKAEPLLLASSCCSPCHRRRTLSPRRRRWSPDRVLFSA